jgi:hypothetical protein
MGEVVNLNQYRKKRERQLALTQAEANRAKFGRGKNQKRKDLADEKGRNADLDGKRIERQGKSDETPEAG